VLAGLAALGATAPVDAVVRPAVSAPATPALAAGEKPTEERVELCDPVLGHIDGDLLLIGWCLGGI
jgi:hypothetical protein